MKYNNKITTVLALLILTSGVSYSGHANAQVDYVGEGSYIIDILDNGGNIYGVFVPGNEGVYSVDMAEELASNEQLDYLFLNLEGIYTTRSHRCACRRYFKSTPCGSPYTSGSNSNHR